MARIAGVNIPTNKRVTISLRYIYGIGPAKAQEICTNLGIPADRRVNQLSDEEVLRIREIVDRDYRVEGDLRRPLVEERLRLGRSSCLGSLASNEVLGRSRREFSQAQNSAHAPTQGPDEVVQHPRPGPQAEARLFHQGVVVDTAQVAADVGERGPYRGVDRGKPLPLLLWSLASPRKRKPTLPRSPA